MSSWQSPKFKIGQWVEKWTGDYTGPGIVRGITTLENGRLRYLVGHRIEGGTGEFLHVYAEGNLRLRMTDGASAEFDWKVEAERLARLLAEGKAREQALEAAALAFIAKVERGEVRSRRSMPPSRRRWTMEELRKAGGNGLPKNPMSKPIKRYGEGQWSRCRVAARYAASRC